MPSMLDASTPILATRLARLEFAWLPIKLFMAYDQISRLQEQADVSCCLVQTAKHFRTCHLKEHISGRT